MTPILGLAAKVVLGVAAATAVVYTGFKVVSGKGEKSEIERRLNNCKSERGESGPKLPDGHISSKIPTPPGSSRTTKISGGSSFERECFSYSETSTTLTQT